MYFTFVIVLLSIQQAYCTVACETHWAAVLLDFEILFTFFLKLPSYTLMLTHTILLLKYTWDDLF